MSWATSQETATEGKMEKYINHLRSEYRKSPLEADLQNHKSRWLQLRIAKAEHELMPVAKFDQSIQTCAELTPTMLSD